MRKHQKSSKLLGLHRLSVVALGAFSLISASVSLTYAQGFPTKPISLIVGFPPGGTVDMTARLVAPELSKILGQPVVVENRSGAGGLIAYRYVANAPADGYTLATIANGSFIVGPRLQEQPSIKLADFSPVGMISELPMVLVVRASSDYKSFDDFMSAVRKSPGQVAVGVPGAGSTNHIATVELARQANVSLNQIPYRGMAPVLNDLIGGQIDGAFDQVTASLSHIRAGTLRPLVVSSNERTPDLPEVPTFAESGLKEFDVRTTIGIVAPAGTPPDVIDKLNSTLREVLSEPNVLDKLREMGAIARAMGVSDYKDYLITQDEMADSLLQEGLLKFP